MEKGFIVFLDNLEVIHDSFFDVFNQNFRVFGKNKFARVSLGENQDSQCQIHPNFRVFILLNQMQTEKEEPALLNRFTKQSFDISEISNEKNMQISDLVAAFVEKFKTKDLSITLDYLFPTYSKENILYHIKYLINE